MQLVFPDQTTIELLIFDTQLGNTYKKIYKHLSAVDIPYKPWDNPYYYNTISYYDLIDRLVEYGKVVGVEVDAALCKSQDQGHFNVLHKIYEKNYNGTTKWLEFHEHIHLCEQYFMPKRRVLFVDYREKSGPLERPMQKEWLHESKTKVNAGDIYVSWAELGKPPYTYWKNKEPNDINRMCELAKPWLKLRPKICIALEDVDFLENQQVDEFNAWWCQFEKPWASHWGLESWSIDNMYGVNILGNTAEVDKLVCKLQNNQNPIRVSL